MAHPSCRAVAREIGIFNRSHYEDVLVERVHPDMVRARGLDPDLPDFWDHRLGDLRNFESYLRRQNIIVLKLFLHISPEEQRQRLLKRLDHPEKRWKFSPSDLKEREFWPHYTAAYEEAIRATATPDAPGSSFRRTINGSPACLWPRLCWIRWKACTSRSRNRKCPMRSRRPSRPCSKARPRPSDPDHATFLPSQAPVLSTSRPSGLAEIARSTTILETCPVRPVPAPCASALSHPERNPFRDWESMPVTVSQFALRDVVLDQPLMTLLHAGYPVTETAYVQDPEAVRNLKLRSADIVRCAPFKGVTASCVDHWASNFYHWVAHTVPTLHVLSQAGRPVRLGLPEHMHPWQFETLELLD